ncbi:MAG: outer membrane protein transport protein [Desulfatiglandales bacterium]
MKKLFMFLCMLGLIFSLTSPLIAGGIDNKHNYSAEYIRTLNRNAATDSADAVAYNPAGVMRMEDGLYLNLSAQYPTKTYSNTVGGIDYEDDEPNIIPGLFALYKKDRWAGFAAFTIPAGGGTIKYERGNATTLTLGQGYMAAVNALAGAALYDNIKNQRLEAESVYHGYTVGGAYALSDMVSISLAARYIDAQKEAQGSVTISPSALGTALGQPDRTAEIDYEQSDDGCGGIVGINIAPTEELNMGIRYETKTGLDLEYNVKKDDLGLYTHGEKENRDLPALLGLGVAYKITPAVKLEASFVYYLNEDADWSATRLQNVDNGYDMGIALEYTFNPQLKGSLGYLYTETGIDADNMLPEAPELDAHSVAAGVCYEAIPGLSLNVGLGRTFYLEETTSSGVKYNKEVTGIVFGIQYKFK